MSSASFERVSGVSDVFVPVPQSIRLLTASRALEIGWSDGRVSRFPHALLRERCRCAVCESTRRQGGAVVADAEIRILEVVPFGPNALQLRFSDGHERGIYPFAWLLELREVAPDAR